MHNLRIYDAAADDDDDDDVHVCTENRVEFPDTETIRRRTATFRQHFVEHFVTLYSGLPSPVQMSALAVAVRSNHAESPASSSPGSVVSLQQYLCDVAVPHQIPTTKFILTISAAQFDLLRQARTTCDSDFVALARQTVRHVVGEAASELARAFEYQLALVADEATRLVARRGAERAMDYIRCSGGFVDVNSVTRGVLEGQPPSIPDTVAAIVGPRRHLEWNVDDMFRRPGLRREALLVAGGISQIGGYGTPWRFFASSSVVCTDAAVYGYRSQLPRRDFRSDGPLYCLDDREEAAYDVEVPWKSADFHRTYRPYRRLVGSDVMAAWTTDARDGLGLGEFAQRIQGEVFRRDEVEPVFRPLRSPGVRPEDERSTIRIINGDVTAPTLIGFHYSDTISMTDNNWWTHAAPETECGRQKGVSTSSSTPRMDCHVDRRVEPVRIEQVGSTRPANFRSGCRAFTAAGVTDTHCECGHDSLQTVELAVSGTASKRHRPPPPVKPKPTVRRHASAATTDHGDRAVTSLPVSRRQSSVDGCESTPVLTDQFPTVEELFGLELARLRQAVAYLSTERHSFTESTPFTQYAGSSGVTSSAKIYDVAADDGNPSAMLVSDI